MKYYIIYQYRRFSNRVTMDVPVNYQLYYKDALRLFKQLEQTNQGTFYIKEIEVGRDVPLKQVETV